MDKDLARIVATTGMKASHDLGELIPLLAEFLPEAKELRQGVAAAIAEIGIGVLEPAFKAQPELRSEFDQRVAKYGRAT